MQKNLTKYRYLLDKLKSNKSDLNLILEIIYCREDLHKEISNFQVQKDTKLLIFNLDKELKKHAILFNIDEDISSIRDSLNPNSSYWWWFLDEISCDKLNQENYKLANKLNLNWILNLLLLPISIINLGLTIDIFIRLLGSYLNTISTLIACAQGFLTFLVGESVFLKGKRKTILNASRSVDRKKHFSISILYCMILIFIRFSLLNELAVLFNSIGYKDFFKNDMRSAENNFSTAIKLKENFPDAYYNLARLYEEKFYDVKRALPKYKIAARIGSIDAYNALGRIYISQGKYSLATSFLLNGLDKLNPESKSLRLAIITNLGWASLEKGNFVEAEFHLKDALNELNLDTPIVFTNATCLLARVYQSKYQKGDQKLLKKTQLQWQECRSLANPRIPYQSVWLDQSISCSNSINKAPCLEKN